MIQERKHTLYVRQRCRKPYCRPAEAIKTPNPFSSFPGAPHISHISRQRNYARSEGQSGHPDEERIRKNDRAECSVDAPGRIAQSEKVECPRLPPQTLYVRRRCRKPYYRPAKTIKTLDPFSSFMLAAALVSVVMACDRPGLFGN